MDEQEQSREEVAVVKQAEKRRERKLDRFLIFAGLAVVLTALVGTYLAYTNAKTAERNSNTALVHSQALLVRARKNRLVVQYKLCVGQNQLKRVTNLDRETFQASIVQQKASLKVVTDPVLHKLILVGLARSRKELAARPFLPLLQCKKLVASPPVPPVKTPTP